MSDTNSTGSTTTSNAVPPEQMAAILTAVAQVLNSQAQPAATPVASAAQTSGTQAQDSSTTGTNAAAGTDASNASGAAASGAQALAPATGTGASAAQPPAGDAAVGAGAQGTAPGSDPESLALLKKIDTNVTGLSASVAAIQKTAVRNGAIAGGVAGGVSGGIVATGIAFIRAHLGI